MATKLSASTDDVVWLLPFLCGEARWRNVVFYLGCMQLVVLISWAFSTGGQTIMGIVLPQDASTSWSQDRILDLVSTVLLTLYTGKLFRDWWLEASDDEGGDEHREDTEKAEAGRAVKCRSSQVSDKYSLDKLFTVSMVGSLDDFAVFASFLLSGMYSLPQLSVGVLLGSSVVVLVCLGASAFAFVVRAAEKVPLWAIIGVFAAWTGFTTFALE